MTHAPRRKKRQRPQERSPQASSGPLDHAYRELERWVRERIVASVGEDGDLPPFVDIPLRLPVRLRGAGRDDAARRFREDADRELGRWLEQFELDRLGYQNGHVFCHWCRAPVCEHSSPPDPRSVFIGYEPTGRPRWREFTSWVVDRRDERVDQLFDDRPTPIALYVGGGELDGELLPDFRRGPIRIACQAVAGLFSIPSATVRGQWESIATTVQLIERRLEGGDPSYSLNVISTVPEGHHLPTLLDQSICRLLSRYIASLRTELQRLADEFRSARRHGKRISLKRARERARQTLERAPGLLDKFLRQGSRRTEHAEERRSDPERPTAPARADALRRGSELFFDRQQGTIIVRGPRNRVHVFRSDGTHITSVVYPGRTVEQRLKGRRWVPLDPHRAAEFTATLRTLE